MASEPSFAHPSCTANNWSQVGFDHNHNLKSSEIIVIEPEFVPLAAERANLNKPQPILRTKNPLGDNSEHASQYKAF